MKHFLFSILLVGASSLTAFANDNESSAQREYQTVLIERSDIKETSKLANIALDMQSVHAKREPLNTPKATIRVVREPLSGHKKIIKRTVSSHLRFPSEVANSKTRVIRPANAKSKKYTMPNLYAD